MDILRVDSGNETYPSDTSGLKNPDGSILQYTLYPSSNPSRYCLTETKGNLTNHVAPGGQSTDGPCPSHSGSLPAKLTNCPVGFIPIPGNSYFGTNQFCVMKYEAKNDGSSNAVSTAGSAPWVSISQTTAISKASAACSGCHLITEAEWLTIIANIMSVPTNWSGGSVGNGYIYSGHNDSSPDNALAVSNPSDGYSDTGNVSPSNQKRTLTLTNGEVIWDMAGNVWEWTAGTIGSNQQPGLTGESTYVWKQWNSADLLWNGLPAAARLANIYPGAASWDSVQGVGRLYSNLAETGVRAFIRGGTWYYGSYAGVLALNLSVSSGGAYADIGFRVSR